MPALLPFLAFAFIAAYTPGPNNCMALSHAARGLRSGLLFSVGVFGGMLIVMAASALLGGFLLQHLDSAGLIMKIAGCVYMLWLARSLWIAGDVADEPLQAGGKLLASGCLLQLVNPKLIAYGITVFSVFILPYYQSPPALLFFVAVTALIGVSGTLAWACGGVVLRRAFSKHPVLINRLLAAAVVLCAGVMLL